MDANDRDLFFVLGAFFEPWIDAVWQTSDVERVARLLDWAGNADCRTAEGNTPLMLVKTRQCVRRLLDAGADVNARGQRDGASPLHVHAARTDDDDAAADVVRELIAAGADINAVDWGRATPVMRAMRVAVACVLLDAGAPIDPLACGPTAIVSDVYWFGKDFDLMRFFIERGANVNIQLGGSVSPLHWHIHSVPHLRFFIEAGADMDLKTELFGRTPLQEMLRHDHRRRCALFARSAAFLIACGCSVDDAFRSALHDEEPIPGLFDEEPVVEAPLDGAPIAPADRGAAVLLQFLEKKDPSATFEERLACAHHVLNRTRVGLIRRRATDICVALQALELPALLTLAIVDFGCEPFANCVRMAAKWDVVTAVKHFRQKKRTLTHDVEHSATSHA